MANTSLYNSLFNTTSNKMKGGGFNPENTLKLIQEKKTFLIMIFANLIVQLGITYYMVVNTQAEVLEKKLKIMDATAIALIQDSHIPIAVFSIYNTKATEIYTR